MIKKLVTLLCSYLLSVQLFAGDLGEVKRLQTQFYKAVANHIVTNFEKGVVDYNKTNWTLGSFAEKNMMLAKNDRALIGPYSREKMPKINIVDGVATARVQNSTIEITPLLLVEKKIRVDGNYYQLRGSTFADYVTNLMLDLNKFNKSTSIINLFIDDAEAVPVVFLAILAVLLLGSFGIGAYMRPGANYAKSIKLIEDAEKSLESMSLCKSEKGFIHSVGSIFESAQTKAMETAMKNMSANAPCADVIYSVLPIDRNRANEFDAEKDRRVARIEGAPQGLAPMIKRLCENLVLKGDAANSCDGSIEESERTMRPEGKFMLPQSDSRPASAIGR